MNRKRIISYAVISFLVLSVILALNWFFTHSTLVIKSPDNVTGVITYDLTNQSTGKTDHFESNEKSFTRRVIKGDYEVVARVQGQSYFEITSTKPFLRTTVLSAQYSQEGKREFIGDSPESCASYQGAIAITYSCNGPVSDILAHMPATGAEPTFTQNSLDDIGNLENHGVITLGGRTYFLGYGHTDLESTDEESKLFEINNIAAPVTNYTLKDLEHKESYRITSFRTGFLLYDDDFEEFLYYSNPDAVPERLNIEPLGKEGFTPVAVSAGKETLAVVYSQTEDAEKKSTEESHREGKTYVILRDNSGQKTFEFDEGYTFITLCGNTTLCYQNGDRLSVYDVKGKNQALLFKVTGVKQAIGSGDSVLVEKNYGVVKIDPAKRTGFVSYGSGDYSLCGIYGNFADGYGVCVSGKDNRMNLLSVSTTLPDIDGIDKKVGSIAAQPYIDTVTAYKSNIFISPNLGELTYNPATQGYEPDAAIKAQNSVQINALLNELGVNRNAYNIVIAQ